MGPARERLSIFAVGAFSFAYGIWVATQTSGFFMFSVAPAGLAAIIIIRAVQHAGQKKPPAAQSSAGAAALSPGMPTEAAAEAAAGAAAGAAPPRPAAPSHPEAPSRHGMPSRLEAPPRPEAPLRPEGAGRQAWPPDRAIGPAGGSAGADTPGRARPDDGLLPTLPTAGLGRGVGPGQRCGLLPVGVARARLVRGGRQTEVAARGRNCSASGRSTPG